MWPLIDHARLRGDREKNVSRSSLYHQQLDARPSNHGDKNTTFSASNFSLANARIGVKTSRMSPSAPLSFIAVEHGVSSLSTQSTSFVHSGNRLFCVVDRFEMIFSYASLANTSSQRAQQQHRQPGLLRAFDGVNPFGNRVALEFARK